MPNLFSPCRAYGQIYTPRKNQRTALESMQIEMDTATRWLSILGLGTLCFGISLFVLRIPVRTIVVFLVIGLPIVFLWLYVDSKSRQQEKKPKGSRDSTQVCICPICNHDMANLCFENNCACCLLKKGDSVVGHSVNPLQ